jgi:uncharacterized protein (TIGR00369 family)
MSDSPLSDLPEESAICKALGITYGEMTPGHFSTHATISVNHVNKGGVAHGALMSALLDTALGGALVSTLRQEEWCATAQLSISYLEAGQVGTRLIARGRVQRRGKGVAHLAGEVTDDAGVVYATATGTWAIFPAKPANFPSKTD